MNDAHAIEGPLSDSAEPTSRRITGTFGTRRLAGCCLLDGGVRNAPLVTDAGRSVLDLDVAPDHRLLDHWLETLARLEWGVEHPPVRVLHGGDTPPPQARPSKPLNLQIIADANAYRGPAGVVRDAMLDLDEGTEFLVCEAARLVGPGLGELVAHHRRDGGDITIARDPGGAPSGVLIVARVTLDQVAERGFVDLKEQWLRRVVAAGRRVLVHDMPTPTPQLRTRLDLLRAARHMSGAEEFQAGEDSWRPTARLARRVASGWSISPGARVSPSAIVARSIVMEGAVIADDAVVSSSIVLPGARVPPGALVMDRVVT